MVSAKRAGGVDRRFARPPRVACQSVGATQYFDPAAVTSVPAHNSPEAVSPDSASSSQTKPSRSVRRMSALGVRRGKAALSSGCKAHPATAPAGSNRSSHGGDEMAEAFGIAGHELVAARVCRPQRE